MPTMNEHSIPRIATLLSSGPGPRHLAIALGAVAVLTLTGCPGQPPHDGPTPPPTTGQNDPPLSGRPGASHTPGKPAAPPALGQAWSKDDQDYFYWTSQGSQLLDYDWFMALERPKSHELFVGDRLQRFGYLPGYKTSANPDALPIGFVQDRDSHGAWIGLTCAACHTRILKYKTTSLLIDGGPSDADVWSFLSELSQALTATDTDGAKFQGFADRVRARNLAAASDPAALHAKLHQKAVRFADYMKRSTPATPWGPARVDAFGMIFNRVSGYDLNIPDNIHPASAPVSYPFLWDTPYQNIVQWNGSAPNQVELFHLARNVGEALGVFSPAVLNPGKPYSSTVRGENLELLEETIRKLKAPRWPDALFGRPDPDAVARGKKLFKREKCSTCHEAQAPDSSWLPSTHLYPVSALQTDPLMAKNALEDTVDTGSLKDQPPDFIYSFGKKLGPKAPAHTVVGNAIVGVTIYLLEHWYAKAPRPVSPDEEKATGRRFSTPAPAALAAPVNAARPNAARQNALELHLLRLGAARFAQAYVHDRAEKYRARSLDGIWATAPYLHNGSVRSLDELLQPLSARKSSFYITNEFDPKTVGLADASKGFLFDTTKMGNQNTGHLWGTTLHPDERHDLIEYLKTL